MNAHCIPAEHYHPSLHRDFTVYDLSHLDPFQFPVSSAKAGRPLRVNVRFTNHCFSEAYDPVKHSPDEPAIIDGRRRRAFCLERYALSHRLPSLVQGLGTPGSRVHETAARRNWTFAATVQAPAPGTRYQIFFELRRAVQDRRRLQDLEMVVESAYPVDPTRPQPNILGRVSFQLLVGSVFLGKRITTRS